jgi:hypothetical protein
MHAKFEHDQGVNVTRKTKLLEGKPTSPTLISFWFARVSVGMALKLSAKKSLSSSWKAKFWVSLLALRIKGAQVKEIL